jgi:hypothetical protein
LLRSWLARPLLQVKSIQQRQTAIKDLKVSVGLLYLSRANIIGQSLLLQQNGIPCITVLSVTLMLNYDSSDILVQVCWCSL